MTGKIFLAFALVSALLTLNVYRPLRAPMTLAAVSSVLGWSVGYPEGQASFGVRETRSRNDETFLLQQVRPLGVGRQEQVERRAGPDLGEMLPRGTGTGQDGMAGGVGEDLSDFRQAVGEVGGDGHADFGRRGDPCPRQGQKEAGEKNAPLLDSAGFLRQ